MSFTDWLPRLANSLRQRYPALTLVIDRAEAGHIVLGKIVIAENKRGQGIATAVLAELLSAADHHGDIIALSPAADWGALPAQLVRWYTRLGFVFNRGCMKDLAITQAMYRRPNRPARMRPVHPEPEAAPAYAGATRVLYLPDERAPIRIPGCVPERWLDEHAQRLLITLRGFGLEPRTDWCHGTRQRSVRLLVGDNATQTHGEIMIGVHSGRVLRGYLTMPGRTSGMAEFGQAGNWLAVLAAHSELLTSRTMTAISA